MFRKELIQAILIMVACMAAGVALALLPLPGWAVAGLALGVTAFLIYSVVRDLRDAAEWLDYEDEPDYDECNEYEEEQKK